MTAACSWPWSTWRVATCPLYSSARGRLALPRALELVRQVVSALSAAHRRGIVHRDLKPANVFVLRDEEAREDEIERVKLMDFGLSKWTEARLRSLPQSLPRPES